MSLGATVCASSCPDICHFVSVGIITDRQTDRQRDRDRDRDRQRQTETETDRDRDRERGREIERSNEVGFSVNINKKWNMT